MRKLGVWLGALLLVLVASVEASAQRRVTGSVSTTEGQPIGNVVVNVQGTALGTYTADDGKFVLNNVPNNAVTLVVRRIGYRRVLQPLAANVNQIDIRLVKDVLELERQVVTGTTTSISSVNAANAVAAVSGEQLNKAPTPTIENALQGKIPGAVISQNSGAPGGGMQVQMRGTTSINANSSPLYVVDGVIVSNAVVLNGMNSITTAGGGVTNSQDQPVNRIADLNPADIENIEVLKGASAGAIYGSLASNGVIVITTKRGSAGRTTASITQRMGQFTIGHKLGLRCFGSAAEVTAAFDATAAAEWQANNGACHDFEEQFYGGNPLSYETDLSLRGGNGGTTFYVAGLAKRDNAIQKNSYYQKQSVSANLNQLIGSRLTLRSNNEFMHSLTDRGLSGNDNNDIVSPGDVFASTPTWIDLAAGGRNPYLPSGSNAFQNANLVKLPEDVFRYIGSVNTTFSAYSSPKQTLDFSLLGGIDAFSYNGKVISPPEAYFESNDGLPGTIVVNKSQNVNANLNLSARHKYTISLATATTSAGLRQQRRQVSLITNSGRNLPSGVSDVNFGVVQVVGENQSLIKDFAYFAQEEILAFNERLLLTGGVNLERSSVNGDDKKFYAFPKAAASYRLPFLPPFTDELKVRLAYGKAGNQPPYGFKFTTLPISVYGGQLGARPSTIAGAPNVRPETSTELEGGLDAQFLGGRAAVDVTVFKKNVTDLILSASVANTSGFSTRFLNAGSLQNTGTEIGLNVTPVQRRQPELGVAHDVRQRRRPDHEPRRSAVLQRRLVLLGHVRRTVRVHRLLADDGAGAERLGHDLRERPVRLAGSPHHELRERPQLQHGLLERDQLRPGPTLRTARLASGRQGREPDERVLRPRDGRRPRLLRRHGQERRAHQAERHAGYLLPRGCRLREAARDLGLVHAAAQPHAVDLLHADAGRPGRGERAESEDLDAVHGLRSRGVQLLEPEHRPVPGRDAISAGPQPVRLDLRQLLITDEE